MPALLELAVSRMLRNTENITALIKRTLEEKKTRRIRKEGPKFDTLETWVEPVTC